MIFLIFIIIPIIEIIIFINIGNIIGIWKTVFIILITALVGIFLLISGLLLITPGFFTDCVGFAVFLKPVQDFIALRAKNYFVSRTRRY